ncbi:HNH endonuclease [Nocardia elegans]|uniref:HNH endonuclease n=1 Tax=Nocardia elegans TaxID=300029 RepID=A0ABW6T9V6_9NOCA
MPRLKKAEYERRRALETPGVTKYCGKCHSVKPVADYGRQAKTCDGLNTDCRSCDVLRKSSWRISNPERNREGQRIWRENNPLVNRLHDGVSRARKAGCEVQPITPDDLLAHWKAEGIDSDSCVYCSGPFEHLDHATPIARGGAHSLENVVPACAACNESKYNRTAEEFVTA